MRVSLIFAWYDLWIGFFWDKKKRCLYFFPIPILGIIFKFNKPMKQELKTKMAMDRAKAVFEQKLIPMLVENYEKGIIDFHLRIDSLTHFYIHAQDNDSDTIDVSWSTDVQYEDLK